MKFVYTLIVLGLAPAAVPSASADTVLLKNGDHLTGTILHADAKEVTLKTDYAGEIKIQWAAVKEAASEKAIYVTTSDKKTVSGTLTAEDSNLAVHTASPGIVRVPLASVAIARSEGEQQAYEKSLHPGLAEAWNGGVNLGFALARGNSETTNLNVGFVADRKTLTDHIGLYLNSIYSTSDLPGGGVTANEILAGVRYDKNITKQLFGFGSADYTHDALQDLNVRSIYSAGLGLHAINNPITTLDILAGGNYTRETYSGIAATDTPGVTRNLAGVTVGEDFLHKFGKSTVFTEKFYFYPDLSNTGQYRFALDAGSVTKINKWLGLQLTVSDRYVSDPPIPGTKANDVVFSTGLNVAFSH